MTEHKDFKRVVRARAERTGESYSSALRNVRNGPSARSAAAARGRTEQKGLPVNIRRVLPEVRTTNIVKTVSFYTELLGFDVRVTEGRVEAFVSPSTEGVEVLVNHDDFTLPAGFTVEVESPSEVSALFDRAAPAGIRVIEPLGDSRFSVLDPAGRRVTICAASPSPVPPRAPDSERLITRAIPGSVIEPTAAKHFYGDYLGFEVRGEWSSPDAVMFASATSPNAELLTGRNATSPDAFDVDVGTRQRVDTIHAAAVGHAVIMGAPENFPDHGVRCFLIIDPSGVAINVLAPLLS